MATPDEQGPIEVTLEMPTAMGATEVTLRIPRGPLTLAQMVPFAQELTHILVDRAVEREELDGRRISCRAGCHACCWHPVALSIPEAFALADVVVAMDEVRRDAILARFEAAERAVAAGGLMPTFEALMRGEPEDATAAGFRYLNLGIPCPFLEDERCSIYSERPTVCRDYLVTSPAANCGSKGLFPIRKVPTPVRLAEPLARLTGRLLRQPPIVVPLTLAMQWVDTHASLSLRNWPGLDVLLLLLEELGVKRDAIV